MTPAARTPARTGSSALALAAALLVPAAARAGNGDLPRTPMIHLGEQCLTVVDRSVDPVVHLDYTIPNTDICLTADELPGSRTHQYVAFCRGDPPARKLPQWHTRADADAAVAAGLFDSIPASAVLDEHPDYAGCWTPILAADERRPITCAAARPGVDWDTTGLAPGAYLVRGYTYEPPLNDWSPRHGVYKVVDGPDPAAAPPALGFAARDNLYLWKDQPAVVRLCADAMPGSTVTLAYGLSVEDPAWIDAVVDAPLDGPELTLEFLPPADVAGQFLALRATVRDPMGRSSVAHFQDEVKVETIPDPSADPTGTTGDDETTGGDSSGGGDPYDFCAENPDADELPDCPDPSGTTGTGGDTDTGDPGAGDGGCCSVRGAPGPAALLLLLLGLRRRPGSAIVAR